MDMTHKDIFYNNLPITFKLLEAKVKELKEQFKNKLLIDETFLKVELAKIEEFDVIVVEFPAHWFTEHPERIKWVTSHLEQKFPDKKILTSSSDVKMTFKKELGE